MKPQADRATEGRVNPKGVPCLYGARDLATAVAEVRPAKNEIVTVAVFKATKNLKVIECLKYHDEIGVTSLLRAPFVNGRYQYSLEDVEQDVWTDIDKAFSHPVSQSDDRADYVPTQVLAEIFKDEGYDGIFYRSRLSPLGVNVAFFYPRVARVQKSSELYVVTDIKTVSEPYEDVEPPTKVSAAARSSEAT